MNSLVMALATAVSKEKLLTDLRDVTNLALQHPEDKEIHEQVLFHSQMILFNHIGNTDPEALKEMTKKADFFESAEALKGILKK